ncbi:unnamed protein product, partial [Phaeothamnion confervicola]
TGAYSASFDFGTGLALPGSNVFGLDFIVQGTATLGVPTDVSLTFVFVDEFANTFCIGNAAPFGACSNEPGATVQVTRLADTIPVPEPATLLLVLGAGVAASLTQRRRRVARAD